MEASASAVTVPALQQMKRDARKIVGGVAWDYRIAQIVDRAGVDIVSVGGTVGVNLWGEPKPLAVTLEEMIVVAKAVRRGVKRALVSCAFPYGPLQQGTASALDCAVESYASVARITLDAITAYANEVRAGRPIKGAATAKPAS